jgi:hypothetical protein
MLSVVVLSCLALSLLIAMLIGAHLRINEMVVDYTDLECKLRSRVRRIEERLLDMSREFRDLDMLFERVHNTLFLETDKLKMVANPTATGYDNVDETAQEAEWSAKYQTDRDDDTTKMEGQ